jgi:hypothetical protein
MTGAQSGSHRRVAEVAGAPVWAQLPPGEGVPVRGRDVKGWVASHVHRHEGTPAAYLPHVHRPVTWDRRNGHATAIEVPAAYHGACS